MKVELAKQAGFRPSVWVQANETIYDECEIEARIKMLRVAKAWLKKQKAKK